MNILIKNGHVIDPSQKLDCICDIVVRNNTIASITRQKTKAAARKSSRSITCSKGKDGIVIDAAGRYVVPGLVDMHVHLREPGFEYKETIQSGTLAAVRGGVTSVCCMPNTKPVHDNASVTEFIMKKAHEQGACKVFPIGAITKGQKGEELAEMTLMFESGCIAFSDDGRPVMNSLMMRRALEYAQILGVPVISHCEDLQLVNGGVMNEGLLSVTMGLKGSPEQAEAIMVGRDIALAELTGGRLHIAHVSTASSVSLIRAAKKRGIASVTAETCPHYFHITEEAVRNYNTNAKVNPPLRQQKDVDAVREGLRDGTIDVIATDHAPHHPEEKLGEFDTAPSGISGLETSLGLSMKLVDDRILTMSGLFEKMSLNPSRILGLPTGTLRQGSDADLVIIETARNYTVDASRFLSKSRNTPFDGWVLSSLPVITVSGGKVHSWE